MSVGTGGHPTPSRRNRTRPGLERFSLNARTVASWTLREAIDGCQAAGVGALGVWRDQLVDPGLVEAVRWMELAGLRVSSLCRGGFFTAAGPAPVSRARLANQRAVDEAAALGAAVLVLVPGGLPPGDRDLPAARHRVATALADLVPYARDHGVRLGLEPMHPLYAADRGVVSTLAQALDLAEEHPAQDVGVVVDTYHVWWDPDLPAQLARAGPRIASYQISDWITPLPADTLLARGMVGDGHIDFAAITAAVIAAGYGGDIEAEIFNADLWAAPGGEVVATVCQRYLTLVHPFCPGLTPGKEALP